MTDVQQQLISDLRAYAHSLIGKLEIREVEKLVEMIDIVEMEFSVAHD